MHIYDNCPPPLGAQPLFPQGISKYSFMLQNVLPCFQHPHPTPPGVPSLFPQEIISLGNFKILISVTKFITMLPTSLPYPWGPIPVFLGNNFREFQQIYFCYKSFTMLPAPYPWGSHPCFLKK